MEDDNPLNTPKMESFPRIPIPPRSNDRPKLSYSGLIAMAIQNLPGQKASLNDIYDWIKDAFPYYNRYVIPFFCEISCLFTFFVVVFINCLFLY